MKLEGEVLEQVVNAVQRLQFGSVKVTVYMGEVTSILTEETRKVKLPQRERAAV